LAAPEQGNKTLTLKRGSVAAAPPPAAAAAKERRGTARLDTLGANTPLCCRVLSVDILDTGEKTVGVGAFVGEALTAIQ